MRHLFHLGLFLGALAAATSVGAQPKRHADRGVKVVVSGHGHPKHHSKKKVYRLPPERSYGHHGHYGHYGHDKHYRHRTASANRRLRDEQRDLQQIVDISRAWKRATIRRDRYEQALTDRRLEAWLDRELRDARRDAHPGYQTRVRELSRQLDALRWRFESGRVHRHHYTRKSEILGDLVALSERQVYRARANTRPSVRLSFANR